MSPAHHTAHPLVSGHFTEVGTMKKNLIANTMNVITMTTLQRLRTGTTSAYYTFLTLANVLMPLRMFTKQQPKQSRKRSSL